MKVLGITVGEKTVDGVLSSLTRIIEDLDEVVHVQSARAAAAKVEADKLTSEASHRFAEAARAKEVQARIAKLVA